MSEHTQPGFTWLAFALMTGSPTSAIIQNIREEHLFHPDKNDAIAIAAGAAMRPEVMAEIGNAAAV